MNFRTADGRIKMPIQLIIWLISVAFGTGVALSTFATKSEVEARDEAVKREYKQDEQELQNRLDKQYSKIMDKLIEMNEKLGSKKDKR